MCDFCSYKGHKTTITIKMWLLYAEDMTLLFSQSLFGFVLLQKVLLNEGLITREKLSQYASQTSYSLATNITVLSAQLNTKCLFTLLLRKENIF